MADEKTERAEDAARAMQQILADQSCARTGGRCDCTFACRRKAREISLPTRFQKQTG